ncbi:hypothetical protein HPP92_014858 [Vanilla planifolia]|uniref:Uncharacterized protein n=1 Tax=Vanilla planifolia TaxID=51239 RepID=A0A835QGT3_VANPL|nr:hypothetical protein HPP92_014858 [Vanilla planifolia]
MSNHNDTQDMCMIHVPLQAYGRTCSRVRISKATQGRWFANHTFLFGLTQFNRRWLEISFEREIAQEMIGKGKSIHTPSMN